jgi:hypothetical protein
MSDFTDFLSNVKKWVGRPDFDDALTTSFVRMAETTLSQTLRVKEMVVRSVATITEGRVALPLDFVHAELIVGPKGKPLLFRSPTEYFEKDHRPEHWYTIIGGEILFAAPIDEIEGAEITMWYFQFVPTFTGASTWLHSKYYHIFLQSCNAAAALFSQEYERATSIEGIASGLVQMANDTYEKSKTSGSVLRTQLVRRKI